MINSEERAFLEAGLKQRAKAINLFLNDIYTDKKIVRDRIIPGELIDVDFGYEIDFRGVRPPRNIYNHISTFHLAKGADGSWYVLKDSVQIPTDIPSIHKDEYSASVRKIIDYIRLDKHSAIFYSEQDCAIRENLLPLADKAQFHLVCSKNLVIENERLFMVDNDEKKERVGALYRTAGKGIDETRIFEIYRKKNLALLNAPGSNIANNRSIYYFIPRMVRYYLGEEPLLKNIPLYIPISKKDMRHIEEHFEEMLFFNSMDESQDPVNGSALDSQEKETFLYELQSTPAFYTGQDLSFTTTADDESTDTGADSDSVLHSTVIMTEQPIVFLN